MFDPIKFFKSLGFAYMAVIAIFICFCVFEFVVFLIAIGSFGFVTSLGVDDNTASTVAIMLMISLNVFSLLLGIYNYINHQPAVRQG